MVDAASVISELLVSPTAGMVREVTCFKTKYSLVLPSGVRITAGGMRHFSFQDNQGATILDVRFDQPCCAMPEMTVRLQNSPTLVIRMKGMMSRSVLVFNENDIPVLRVRRPRWVLGASCEYQILGNNNIEIGKIKKDWLEYDVYYPADLDMRYKAALLATCMFIDILIRRRR